jgi:hypothetical protein
MENLGSTALTDSQLGALTLKPFVQPLKITYDFNA